MDNDLFFKLLFHPIDRIVIPHDSSLKYEPNYVLTQNVIQYGKVGSGKTECVRSIVEKAVEYYGEENVNAVINSSDYPDMTLQYGLDKKLIQIIIFDDFTLAYMDDHFLNNFFRIRHLYKSLTNNKYGYIITIFNTHRYYSLQKEIRSNVDMYIVRSSPSSLYDRSAIQKIISKRGLEDLFLIDEQSTINPSWRSVAVFSSKRLSGIIKLDMAKQDYIKDVISVAREIFDKKSK